MSRGLVCGVGFSDIRKSSKTKSYLCWLNMLKRCYDEQYLQRYPSYLGSSVCEEWLTFSIFEKWYNANYPKEKGVYHLDKDLIERGNKVYGPSTCIFVPNKVNTFIIDCLSARGEYPLGVYYNNGYVSRCRNPLTNEREWLGRFKTPLEAHNAWKKRKYEIALELAESICSPNVANVLIKWAKNLLSDCI